MFKFYIDNRSSFVSSNELAAYFLVSIRTIKNDLKIVKSYSNRFHSFTLETIPSKGTRLCVHDEKKFKEESLMFKQSMQHFTSGDTTTRTQTLLRFLLDSNSYISKYTLIEMLFISESTLYHALQDVKQILSKYHLNLIHKTNAGYRVEGNEVDKRICITKQELNEETSDLYEVSQDLCKVYDTVADTFFKHKYQINEQVLQNITAHITLTIKRVKNGNIIDVPYAQDLEDSLELEIANDILSRFLHIYRIPETSYDNEVRLLAQTILGKTEYAKNDKLQKEVNDFINDSFLYIKHKFCVNFEPIENLKLFLALHLVPLFYRIKSGSQLANIMSPEIRQSFPLAYDIALYFSILIHDHFHLNVSQDEISYLSLYFNYGLENVQLGNGAKRILIITALRKSETVLLRHKILTWFPNQIAEINFVDTIESDIDLEDYDAVFSTDKDGEKYKGGITMISIFPDEKDFEKINLSINGYTDKNLILNKFYEDCFYYGDASSKDEIMDIVCGKAMRKFHLSDEFRDVIKAREQISSTYFGNYIAIPHPLTPFSDETFVSIGVLKKPIHWDRNHSVSIVMLVSIEKNNPKAFQFWYYISTLVRNEELFQSFYKLPTYENFINILKQSLTEEFNS